MCRRRSIGLKLFHLILPLLFCAGLANAQTTYLGSYTWTSEDWWVGGLSGLEVSENGTRFVAISDHAQLVFGEFGRSQDAITGIQSRKRWLHNESDHRLTEHWADGEGLVMDAAGNFYVSFERHHRVWKYDATPGLPSPLPANPLFETHQTNASLEALAMDGDGAIITIPERSGLERIPYPVYRFKDGEWSVPFTLPRSGKFVVTGADFGPDGRLYILERDNIGFWFRSRIRRFDPDGTNEETVLQTFYGTHDNLEGISVWRDLQNRIRMTLVSDDNFLDIQVTEFVEYSIDS